MIYVTITDGHMTIFSNQITDADEACRSSEISVNLIIIIVFLQTCSYFCYILTSFFVLLCYILDVYIYIIYIRLKIKPNSVRIRFLSCQIFVLPSTGFELTPLIHCSTTRLALCQAPQTTRPHPLHIYSKQFMALRVIWTGPSTK